MARAFAEAGCRALAITDIDGKKLLATKDYIISKNEAVTVLTATGDIADEKFVNSFVNGVVAEVGRLDFAVCVSLSPFPPPFHWRLFSEGLLVNEIRSTAPESWATTSPPPKPQLSNSIASTTSTTAAAGCRPEQSCAP